MVNADQRDVEVGAHLQSHSVVIHDVLTDRFEK